jgi:hypothetical protein
MFLLYVLRGYILLNKGMNDETERKTTQRIEGEVDGVSWNRFDSGKLSGLCLA